ncbi:MAG: L-seryl-tRNA(Sec) selenium transferase [Acidobacteria bacterium]|nr:L-seryl-tRNA(Sec) selenium transferase [Acidobacteriota bacterium]
MEDVSQINQALRALPAVHEVLAELAHEPAPRALLVNEIRAALDHARARMVRDGTPAPDIAAEVRSSLAALRTPSLRRVINATGVVLHTNLGRAPLPSASPAGLYSNLEYDLATGRRGKRDVHTGALLKRLLGAPAIAVNNNAAAVYLALRALAANGEVIVSRGELIEIGDGFRIPDIMACSGAHLVEVGTTNRTRIDDYAAAINERTRLLMIVHPSNFHMSGFTGKPAREELVALGRKHGLPVYEDLGSGCLIDLSAHGIAEPRVQEALAAGVDIVSFSGDKLLSGPQAGLLAGRDDLIARLRRDPMYRALRLDKLVLAALERALRATLLDGWDDLPALRMIRLTPDDLRPRADRLAAQLGGQVIAGESVIGGGSTPEQTLPTWLVALPGDAMKWEERLRQGEPPVIARIDQDRLVLDLRTTGPEEDAELARALQIAAVGG